MRESTDIVAIYILPMAICIGSLPPKQAWETGFFVQAGQMLGGPLLKTWILAAAAVGSMGQYISNQAANAYLMLGMAELGYLPGSFAARSKHGMPPRQGSNRREPIKHIYNK